MNSIKKNIIQLNIAILITGLSALAPKVIPLSASYLSLGKAITASIFLFLFLIIKKQSMRIPINREYFTLLLSGIFFCFSGVLILKAIKISNVNIGVLSFFSYPIMLVFIQALFFKTKIHLIDIFLAVLVFIGIFFIIPTYNLSNDNAYGALLGISAAVLFCFRIIISSKLLSSYSSILIVFYQLLITSICLLPILFLFEAPLHKINFLNLTELAIFGVFFTVLPNLLIVDSLHSILPKTFGILTSLQPIYSSIFALLLLSQPPSIQVVIGGSFILFSVITEVCKVNR